MGKLGNIFGKGKDKKPKVKKNKKKGKAPVAQEPVLKDEPVVEEDLLDIAEPDAIEDLDLDLDLTEQIDADLAEPIEDAPEAETEAFEADEELSIEPELEIEEQTEDIDIFADAEMDVEPELNIDEEPLEIADEDTPGIAMIDETEEAADESDDFFADIDNDMLAGEDIEVEAPAVIEKPQPTDKPDKKAKKEKKAKKTKEPKVKKAKKVKPPKPVKVKEPKVKKQKAAKIPAKIANPEIIAESDYQTLLTRVSKMSKKLRSVVFGGAGIDTLPVTIPVNIAMQLAKNGKKCLLIDLDLKRNAVASAFGIEEETKPMDFLPRPYDTSLENLKVWPAHNFTKRRYVSIPSLVDAAVNKYDYVLLNAPYLDGHLDRSQIGQAAASALIFTQNEKQTTRLYNLLTSCNTKIISNIQIKS